MEGQLALVAGRHGEDVIRVREAVRPCWWPVDWERDRVGAREVAPADELWRLSPFPQTPASCDRTKGWECSLRGTSMEAGCRSRQREDEAAALRSTRREPHQRAPRPGRYERRVDDGEARVEPTRARVSCSLRRGPQLFAPSPARPDR
jgi:hypothetical protein